MTAVVALSATGLTILFCYNFLYKYYTLHLGNPPYPRSGRHRHESNSRHKSKHAAEEDIISTGDIINTFKESLPTLTREALISNEGRPTY